MSVSRDQVEARFQTLKLLLDSLYLFPVDGEDEGLIGLWHPEIGCRYLILENEDLARVCYR